MIRRSDSTAISRWLSLVLLTIFAVFVGPCAHGSTSANASVHPLAVIVYTYDTAASPVHAEAWRERPFSPTDRAKALAASHEWIVGGPDRAPDAVVAAEAGSMELPAATTWGRADSLADHFARHGGDFGAATEAQYAEDASGFFQQGLRDGLPTKINPKDGSIRIYDPESNTFGSYNANGTTRTFYKPDPAQHGYATNWDYWVSQPGYAP